MLQSSTPFPLEVQQYIRCVTSTAEKFYVQKSILAEQVQAQGKALAKQKEVTTAKRVAITDERLLSAPVFTTKCTLLTA